MPKKELIIALNKSNLEYDPSIIPHLWKFDGEISNETIELLLTALEEDTDEYPEILHLLLTISDMNCTF